MNRIIKFRAWNKRLKKMVYFDQFTIGTNSPSTELRASIKESDGQNYYDDRFDDNEEDEMKDTILLQYIGMKDQDGVEIYEGDIIDFAGLKPIEIVWRENGFKSMLIPYTHSEPIHLTKEGMETFAKVIGHHYENKY